MEYQPPKYIQIIETIKRDIESGRYPVGSQLPSEAALVESFNTSRPTVVRALTDLQLTGVIERRHGVGSFVRRKVGSFEAARAAFDKLDANEEELYFMLGILVERVPEDVIHAINRLNERRQNPRGSK